MVIWNFIDVFSFIQTHGYFVLLLLTLIEGPAATAAGAFAASLGLLNIFAVIGISFLGDILGDTIYFFIGKFGRKSLVDNQEHKWGLSKTRIRFLERKLKKHFFKTLFLFKFTPMLAPPGIMMIGASGISFKKFMINALLIIVPLSIMYAIVGYTLGFASDSFFKYFKIARELLLVLILVVVAVAFLLEKKVFSKIAKKIGNV